MNFVICFSKIQTVEPTRVDVIFLLLYDKHGHFCKYHVNLAYLRQWTVTNIPFHIME